MGFNIATARLGNRTEVRTTQAGDAHWVVTEIDFREMRRRESFHVPLRYATKEDPSAHGTEIVVGDLNPKMLDALKRPNTVAAIRQRLGRIYSYLLRAASPIPGVPDKHLRVEHRPVPQRQAGQAVDPVRLVGIASRELQRHRD